MAGFWRAVAVAAVIAVTACGPRPPAPERLELAEVGFADIAGWRDDRQDEALVAFLRSCERFAPQPDTRPLGAGGVGGSIADWREPCTAAAGVAAGDATAARAFFETWFSPFAASDRGKSEGLFTGYYEPLLSGSRTRSARYNVPLYGRPDDLVTVDLGLFKGDLRGRRIAGRVRDGALEPYHSRAEIDAGALVGEAPVIAWVDDPVDAFFLHVQGSGRVLLPDGEVVRVGYAATNGRDYVSIGRKLIERGALDADKVSLQGIRAWLAARPDKVAEVLGANPSYVFFRELDGDGPLGAQGAVLTPRRSLAVDRRHIPLGVPIWLDIAAPAAVPNAPDGRLRRLVVAQDTGGAIKGPLRGDFFWGFGPEAGALAGRMKHPGRLYLLLPRTVAKGLASGG